jgi:hypothetical protein
MAAQSCPTIAATASKPKLAFPRRNGRVGTRSRRAHLNRVRKVPANLQVVPIPGTTNDVGSRRASVREIAVQGLRVRRDFRLFNHWNKKQNSQ